MTVTPETFKLKMNRSTLELTRKPNRRIIPALVAFFLAFPVLGPPVASAHHLPFSNAYLTPGKTGTQSGVLPIRRVNLRNGNLFLSYTDVSIPGSGFNLEIQRVYNSRSTQGSGFGFGWSFSYGTRLFPTGDQMAIMEPDGSISPFRAEGKTLYRSHTGETVQKEANGYLVTRRGRILEHFDMEGKLLRRSDRNGNIASFRYNGSSLESVTLAGARSLNFSHNQRGLITAVTDPMGRTWRYDYDEAWNLVSAVTPANLKTTFSYDGFHNLKRIIHPNGVETIIAYDDAQDWVLAETGPGGQETRYSYLITAGSNSRYQTVVTNPLGRVTRYLYDENRITIVDATGRETKVLMCAGCPDVEQITDGAGHTWIYRHDARGNLVEAVDAAGGSWTYAYDKWGLLVSRKSPAGDTVRVGRDQKGNPVRFTDATGRSMTMKYDARGNLHELVGASGDRTRYRYDEMGNEIEVAKAAGWKAQVKRDKAGRILEARDPRGGVERFQYDLQDRLVAYTDPAGKETRYTRDALGNLTALSKPGGATETFAYDATNRLIRHTDAMGRATSYRYDAVGNMVERGLPDGTIIRCRHDELGRLTTVHAPDDEVTFKYDPSGRLIEARNRNAHYVYAHDKLDRITSVEFRHVGRRLLYTYDAAGNRSSVALDSEEPTVFGHDAGGRLIRIQIPRAGTLGFEYDASGRLIRKSYPNGLRTVYRYDVLGHVSRMETLGQSDTLVSTIRYTSDPGGLKLARDEMGASLVSYRYDAAGQLLEMSGADGVVTYLYDPRGNRLGVGGRGAPISYRYDAADQLLQTGEEQFDYDRRGNLIQRRAGPNLTQYEYDFNNRLTTVKLPNGKTVRYSYGPLGERVKTQSTSGEVAHFLYDDLTLYARLDGSLRVTARYHSYGLDKVATMESRGLQYFYHTDHLGSVRMLTDKDGKIIRKYDYEPFGLVRVRPNDDLDLLLFTSHPYDQENGLYDFRHRTLDPKLGRFLQRDPLPGGHPYAYADNDPVNRLDPVGLQAEYGAAEGMIGTGLSGLGAYLLAGEGLGFGYTMFTIGVSGLSLPVTAGAAGVVLMVAGGGLAVKGLKDFWSTPNDVADKVKTRTGTIGGSTLQDAMTDPQPVPSPTSCPAPPPSP